MLKAWRRYRTEKPILMPQDDLNKIFERPKCDFETVYSLDFYILLVAVTNTSFSPLISSLCPLFYLVKLATDRVMFFWFFAEPAIDSIELSRKFFEKSIGLIAKAYFVLLVSNFITVQTVIHELKFYKIIDFGGLVMMPFVIFFPYKLVLEMFTARVKLRELKRTEVLEEKQLLKKGVSFRQMVLNTRY